MEEGDYICMYARSDYSRRRTGGAGGEGDTSVPGTICLYGKDGIVYSMEGVWTDETRVTRAGRGAKKPSVPIVTCLVPPPRLVTILMCACAGTGLCRFCSAGYQHRFLGITNVQRGEWLKQ